MPILALSVSRKREYLADASGAELTRNPLELANALEKIEMAVTPTPSIKRGTAHLCIADPLGRKVGLKEGFWSGLLATPMFKRITALKEMAYQGQPSSIRAPPPNGLLKRTSQVSLYRFCLTN